MPNNPTRIGEAKARAARTAIQGTPAWLATALVDEFFYDFSDYQFGLVVAALTMVASFVQAGIENKYGYALFRKFSYTNPPVLSTPETPLADGSVDALPQPVYEAEVARGNTV